MIRSSPPPFRFIRFGVAALALFGFSVALAAEPLVFEDPRYFDGISDTSDIRFSPESDSTAICRHLAPYGESGQRLILVRHVPGSALGSETSVTLERVTTLNREGKVSPPSPGRFLTEIACEYRDRWAGN